MKNKQNFGYVETYFEDKRRVELEIDSASIGQAVELIFNTFNEGKQIFTCGNGGSAATASHYLADWNKMISVASGKRFRGICLNDNMGLITATANDISYEEVFSLQLQALGGKGDLLVAVSGSGNSPNIIRVLEKANELAIKTIAVCGYDGGAAKKIANYSVWVPSFDMQFCEDLHLSFGHIVMKSICGRFQS